MNFEQILKNKNKLYILFIGVIGLLSYYISAIPSLRSYLEPKLALKGASPSIILLSSEDATDNIDSTGFLEL